MSRFQAHSVLVMFLISIVAASVPTGMTMADDEPTTDVDKTDVDIKDNFRVTVPIETGAKQPTKQLFKNSLLNEKLVKMGRAKSQGCTRCHGRSGMQSLAGSNGWTQSIAEFVVVQLTAFRDGKRSHEIMSSVAKPMSDQDIALVAMWYQSVSSPSSTD